MSRALFLSCAILCSVATTAAQAQMSYSTSQPSQSQPQAPTYSQPAPSAPSSSSGYDMSSFPVTDIGNNTSTSYYASANASTSVAAQRPSNTWGGSSADALSGVPSAMQMIHDPNFTKGDMACKI